MRELKPKRFSAKTVLFSAVLMFCVDFVSTPVPNAHAGESSNFDLSRLVEPYDWIDIGGQLRFRGEYRNDYDLKDNVHSRTDDDEFILGRFRLWTRLTPSKYFQAFVEVQSAWEWESENIDTDLPDIGGGNIFQDRLDIQQAYVDIHLLPDTLPLYVRLGRQNLNYGKQRLMGSFQWANVARSFDAVRIRYDDKTWWVDAYIAQVVVHDDNNFNDTDNGLPNAADDSTFYSIYGGYRGFELADFELYWIYRDNEDAGDRKVHTIGTRFEGKNGPWDYDGEFAYQFGDWSEETHIDHQAFALHLGGGYTFKDAPWRPRIGIQYNYATGDDDPADGDHGTFDNLFPTNHLHYGYIDFFSWRNMHHLQFELQFFPAKRLWIKTHLHFFWNDEEKDQWYNAGGGATAGVRAAARRNADSFIGEELDIVVNYVPNLPGIGKALSVQAGYSHFWGEDFVSDTIGGNDGADFAYLMTVLKF